SGVVFGVCAVPGPTAPGTAQTPKTTPDPGTPDGDKQGDWAAKKVEYCRDYRAGRIDQAHRRRLEIAALGAARVKQFCDGVIEQAERGGKGGSGGKGGKGGSGGKGDSGGSGDDKGDGPGGHGGVSGGRGGRDGSVLKLPTVSWSTPPADGSPALPGLPAVPDLSGPALPPAVPDVPPASRAHLPHPARPALAPADAAVGGAGRPLAHRLERQV
ncbi:hypothetical protein ACJA3G_33270, partial [Streptomyces sp. YS-3]